MSLNATDGTPSIGLSGNVTAQGGTGVGGAGALVAASHSTIRPRSAHVTILSFGGTGTSTGAGGAVAFTAAGLATIDSDATPRSLTINAGTSTATLAPRWAAWPDWPV